MNKIMAQNAQKPVERKTPADRLADALRDNLRKRKEQQRAREKKAEPAGKQE